MIETKAKTRHTSEAKKSIDWLSSGDSVKPYNGFDCQFADNSPFYKHQEEYTFLHIVSMMRLTLMYCL